MFKLAFEPHYGLGPARRISPVVRQSDYLTGGELATLLFAGSLATVAVVAISLSLRIPGHAILRAALPMVCGMALVPRRLAGSIMSLGAGAAALGLSAAGVGTGQPAALVALFALGPAIDLAMMGPTTSGWRVYLRFALAGMLANSLAFAVRLAVSWFQLDNLRPHTLTHFGVGVFLSYAACGAVAGLLGAAVCFRFSARPE
jgi:hypothetical protein